MVQISYNIKGPLMTTLEKGQVILHTCPLVLITIRCRSPMVLNKLNTSGTGVQGNTIYGHGFMYGVTFWKTTRQQIF